MMKYLRGKKDATFTYGSPGAGTLEHLTSEYVFKAVPGLQPTHVPFPGGSGAINAILGQQVDVVATALPGAAALIRDGKLRTIAVASHRRMPQLPDAPTLGQSGFPDLENVSWIALFGPAGLPAPVANRLNAKVNEVLQDKELLDRLFKLGLDTRKYSQAEFAAYIGTEYDKWKTITGSIGFSLK
jgi:tripartite-type tricarboxylate transporter receptor subunit TctC